MQAADPRTTPSGAFTARARVLVVDDHSLLRTGVANIINQEAALEVVAEAASGVEAIEAFRVHRPDVVLMDLRMPEMEGVEAVSRIRQIDPHAKVVVLTTYDADEDIANYVRGLEQVIDDGADDDDFDSDAFDQNDIAAQAERYLREQNS